MRELRSRRWFLVASAAAGMIALGLLAARPSDAVGAERLVSALAVDVTIASEAPESQEVFTLTLAGGRGCSSVHASSPRRSTKIEVCRTGGDERAPVLEYELERVDSTPDGSHVQKFRIANRIAIGKSAVIGRFSGSGAGARISAGVRPAD